MRSASKFMVGLIMAGTIAFLAEPAAADPADVLYSAERTVYAMRSDPTFGPSRQLLANARAVLIVPQLVKGGFIFGAEGGNGVLLQRSGRGWSEPAFYTIGSASFGLQIGLEAAQFVMFIMTDRALRAVEQDKFTFGGQAGLTVITVGANARAATGTNLTGDIIGRAPCLHPSPSGTRSSMAVRCPCRRSSKTRSVIPPRHGCAAI
jgi:lipid-binding SYLF domain-containing protein